MWFETKYDDKEIECQFCYQKVKPIIKTNKMRMFYGKSQIRLFGNRSSGIPIKEKQHILICPNCKALIGAKK